MPLITSKLKHLYIVSGAMITSGSNIVDESVLAHPHMQILIKKGSIVVDNQDAKPAEQPTDSPVVNLSEKEALKHIKELFNPIKLKAIADRDAREKIKDAAQKRIDDLLKTTPAPDTDTQDDA